MTTFSPKYVTFDRHGTLINFQIAEATADLYGAQLGEGQVQAFIQDFSHAVDTAQQAGAHKPSTSCSTC